MFKRGQDTSTALGVGTYVYAKDHLQVGDRVLLYTLEELEKFEWCIRGTGIELTGRGLKHIEVLRAINLARVNGAINVKWKGFGKEFVVEKNFKEEGMFKVEHCLYNIPIRFIKKVL